MKALLHCGARVRPFVGRWGVFALVMLLAGCGGGSSPGSGGSGSGGSGSGGSPTVASVSISPASASVVIGATEQFSATAKDSSGNAISGVTFTWSSSSTATATINSSGLATAVAAGTSSITASASGITSSASTLTVTAPPPKLAVSTNLLPGATAGVAYSAALQASGGSAPYTWSASGTLPSGLTLDARTGAISGTPSRTGTSTFTVTVTDAESPAMTATANLSIVVSAATSGSTSLMSGQYAFATSGYDSAIAGSLTVDGKGNVTGGIEDVRAPAPGVTDSAVAIINGTYTVTSDDRGTLSYSDANGVTYTFDIALGNISNGVAASGQMIENDPNQLETTGSLALQSKADFSTSALSGGYAFESWGWDTTPAPNVTVGSFTVNAGTISNGLFDENDAGTVNSAVAFTGSIGTIDANGRGTITLANGSKIDLYIISATSAYLIGDASGLGVQSGLVEQQTGGPFSAASLSGNTIIESRSENGVPSPHATLGQLVFSSAGTFTGTIDTNDSGTVALAQSGSGTWSLTSATNGRVTLTPTGAHTAVGYLVGPNEVFTTDESSVIPSVGTVEPQSAGPFTNASLAGNYYFGTLPLLSPPASGAGVAYNIESGILSFDGKGNLNVTVDVDSSGAVVTDLTGTDTYSVASDGRATQGSGSDVIWIVSPSKAYALQISQGQPSSSNPVIFVMQQ
jgi:Putative Ig domain/Bacterial Ig-like domain (group 2)